MPDEHLTSVDDRNKTIKLTDISRANVECEKKFSKSTLQLYNAYLKDRTLQQLKALLADNHEILLTHITPHEICNQERIREIYDLLMYVQKPLRSEGYFFNTILHSEIANSSGDDQERMHSKTSDQMYSGKIKATYILKQLDSLKKENPDFVRDVLEAEDVHGNTPLSLAIMTRNYGIAAKLLDLGANPNVVISNISKSTPLHIAHATGTVELIEKLKSKGAKEDVKDELGRVPSDYTKHELEARRQDLLAKTFHEVNLFYGIHYSEKDMGKLEEYKKLEDRFFEAIKSGNVEKVRKMAPHVDVNYQDSLGRTAMHLAVMRPSLFNKGQAKEVEKKDRLKILKLLLERSPNLDLKNTKGNSVKDLIDRDKKSESFVDKDYAENCDKVLFRSQGRDLVH